MRSFPLVLLALPLAVAGLASSAPAQLMWGDNFENFGVTGSPPGPYTPGPVGTFGNSSGGITSPTNGAWDAWYVNPVVDGGISSSRNHTPNTPLGQSLEVGGSAGGGCDMVQWHRGAINTTDPSTGTNIHLANSTYDATSFGGGAANATAALTSGVWQYRAWNYIPSSFPTGSASHYFIVNDQYDPVVQNTTWIMQVQFNHATGRVKDDQRPVAPGNPTSGAQIIYDQWVEIVATFDLDNNQAAVSYNGVNIGSGAVQVSGWNPMTAPPKIDNLDLFTTGATSFWDDITLTKLPGLPYQTNTADPNNPAGPTGIDATINNVAGTSLVPAVTTLTMGQTVNINLNNPSGANLEAIVDSGPALPLGGGGFLIPTSGSTSVTLNMALPLTPGSTSLYLLGGTSPTFLPFPVGSQTWLSFQAPPGPLTLSIQWFALGGSTGLLEASQPCTLVVQ